jgi:hypothetical protein
MGKIERNSFVSVVCWSSATLLCLGGILILASMSRFSPAYSYLLAVCAVMMFGWASLMLWADRNHSHRKGVFFTAGLVAAGLLSVQIYGYFTGLFTLKFTLMTGILLSVLGVSFVSSYSIGKMLDCPKRYNIKQSFVLKHLLTRNY